jgi:hypothetical protein
MACSVITLAVHHAMRYHPAMAITYRCRDTEALANGQRVRRFANVEAVARRKLRQLQIAGRLEDLREKTMRELKPVSPGELLREEFLLPMGISQYRLAKEIDVPPQRISETDERARAMRTAVSRAVPHVRLPLP